MEAVINDVTVKNEQAALDTLFSYLDKGIDDMEAGRVYTAKEAFQIVKDRMNNEL